MQLLPSLLSELQAVCATFPDPRKGRGGNIAPTDFGLSAFAMFFMQSASFLAYQRTMEKGHGRSNCRTLFGIGRIPSDNYIRDFLDEADPALLQPCFERMEALLSEPRHLLDPARPHKSRRQPVNVEKIPTARIAGVAVVSFPFGVHRSIVLIRSR